MIRSESIMIALVLGGGCRGDPRSEPPPAPSRAPVEDEASEQSSTMQDPAADLQAPEDVVEKPPMTTPETNVPPPLGPPLSTDAVVPSFRRWWATFSGDQLTSHPLRATLDERVATGGTVRAEACDTLAEHVRERAPKGSPELLHGDPASLDGRTDRCWWLHHDGMLGPGLGAALASDGRVLAVWIVVEG